MSILVSAQDNTPPLSTPTANSCVPCTPAEQNAELERMYRLYRDAVNNARQVGYQCGSDPNYTDYGPLHAKVGNCADWAQVSWGAVVVYTWKCWRVVRVRARHKWTIRSYHNFVYAEPRCGGDRVYFDPWQSGRPDVFVGDAFSAGDGFWGGWIHYPVAEHAPGDPPRDPGR